MIKVDITTKIPKALQITAKEVNNIVLTSLAKLRKAQDLIVEISFVETSEMQSLNNKYRNIDKPTDVLSFPIQSVGSSQIELLGSIVICATIVEEKREAITDVIKHGLLHLVGFDHERDEKEWNHAAKLIDCEL